MKIHGVFIKIRIFFKLYRSIWHVQKFQKIKQPLIKIYFLGLSQYQYLGKLLKVGCIHEKIFKYLVNNKLNVCQMGWIQWLQFEVIIWSDYLFLVTLMTLSKQVLKPVCRFGQDSWGKANWHELLTCHNSHNKILLEYRADNRYGISVFCTEFTCKIREYEFGLQNTEIELCQFCHIKYCCQNKAYLFWVANLSRFVAFYALKPSNTSLITKTLNLLSSTCSSNTFSCLTSCSCITERIH